MATLLLNGKTVTVNAAPDTPLLWVLRDHLKLTGTKFGCGAALCGACTVHVNGVATRSCVTPLSAVAGKRVTSIEGLQGPVGTAVQAAWDKHQVPQCGYCQSGQVMTAAALLVKTPKPSDAEIVTAMRAISAAAAPTGGSGCCSGRGPDAGGPAMTATQVTRRDFLKVSAVAGGGLALGFRPRPRRRAAGRPSSPTPG
jgi:isoquinoline 1-oxidoreductase alpha subunit